VIPTKKEWNVTASLPVAFKVKMTDNVLEPTNYSLIEYGQTGRGARRLVIVDSTVFFGREKAIKSYFDFHNIETKIVPIDMSEDKKNLEHLLYILEIMENFGILRRSEPLICIGGGVLLDMCGLAANLYRRGVPYIKVPTTLLAIVDASVGVKTSINHFCRRNRLGSYYPPVAAYLDRTFLDTLPKEEIVSAMGEIFKMAVIKNSKLFELLETDAVELMQQNFLLDGPAESVISESINDMIVELAPNLWETDLKRIVDFGHSFSPMLEMKSLEDSTVPNLSHGEAVSIDVVFSSCLAHHRGLIPKSELERIVDLSFVMQLPTYHPYFTNYLLLWESLIDTTRHRDGKQNLPIPAVSIGNSIFLNDVKLEDVKETIKLYVQMTGKKQK
tara:strand:+ start:5785 stop:6945 length:1161 start_codon:yes stop_codon:yes gene_type:complete